MCVCVFYIESSEHSDVEGDKLKGNDGEDALETVDRLGYLERLLAEAVHLLVVLVADDERLAAARRHLLIGVETLGLDRIVHDDHHDGHGVVDHGERAVLELAGQNALRVHVGELLDLQGALQARGIVEATAHDQQRLLIVQLLRKKTEEI